MPKAKRVHERAMVATHAKRQGRGKLLEVMAWPREAPEVWHFVRGGEDEYVVSWGASRPQLTISMPRDVFQGIVAAALVAPAIGGQVDGV